MTLKRITILGSTGSIGTQALELISLFSEKFKVVGLSARGNLQLLAEQTRKFQPKIISVPDDKAGRFLKKTIGPGIRIVIGEDGLNELTSFKGAELILIALGGSVGLKPLLEAIDSGKDIALANKEPMVMAGELITERARKKGVRIIPVDSEHSAIFQLIEGRRFSEISRVIITSSGGPFRTKTLKQMRRVSVSQALNHPTWRMGKKVSVDSATLMNKALEMIEARWFFNLPPEKISVLIHPQSIVHSLVEMTDGAMFAHLSIPDMRIPIAYALFYPERPKLNFPRLNLARVRELNFEEPDMERFPGLKLGFQALKTCGTLPAVMNAADEEAVSAFLLGKIRFNRIVELVGEVMKMHKAKAVKSVDDIVLADQWARDIARELINA